MLIMLIAELPGPLKLGFSAFGDLIPS